MAHLTTTAGGMLASLRRQRGLSQEGAAQLGACDRTTYGRIERGEVSLDLDALQRWVSVLGGNPRRTLHALAELADDA